jgi:exosortase D (VPLPA-CTERM-specific)
MPSSPPLNALPGAAVRPVTRWRVYGFSILAILMAWLYFPILTRLVSQWFEDPNYSYGFFVPFFSAWVVWRRRSRLSMLKPEPSAWGFSILVLAMSVLIAGVLGAELFLSRVSLLFVIAGLIVFFVGWRSFRAVLFPWAFLLLMIPVPAIVLTQVTFPLQILTSSISALVLQFMGVPVLREGNIINLPALPLEVAEACSGIRSLLSLTTLTIIYGFLTDTRMYVRVVLALASVPIAVAANTFRIVITGLLAQYWDANKAQGFFHEFSGWLIFLISLALLISVHRLFWGKPLKNPPEPLLEQGQNRPHLQEERRSYATSPAIRFVLTVALLGGSALFLLVHQQREIIPPHQPLAAVPLQLGQWQGRDEHLSSDVLQYLGKGDFLSRTYYEESVGAPYVSLFMAYFPTQRTGDTVHSPLNCLPGSGWFPLEANRIELSIAGHRPFPVNRYYVAKGPDRALVLYWYWAHDRGVASEYWAKFYLVADAMRLNRSDGALVRISVPIAQGESTDTAQRTLIAFSERLLPLMDRYVPR